MGQEGESGSVHPVLQFSESGSLVGSFRNREFNKCTHLRDRVLYVSGVEPRDLIITYLK